MAFKHFFFLFFQTKLPLHFTNFHLKLSSIVIHSEGGRWKMILIVNFEIYSTLGNATYFRNVNLFFDSKLLANIFLNLFFLGKIFYEYCIIFSCNFTIQLEIGIPKKRFTIFLSVNLFEQTFNSNSNTNWRQMNLHRRDKTTFKIIQKTLSVVSGIIHLGKISPFQQTHSHTYDGVFSWDLSV